MATVYETHDIKIQTDESARNIENDAATKGEGEHRVDGGTKKQKRGMKPRSQRNRKRPRSELYSNENPSYETEICRLQLDGRPVNGACAWIRVVKPYSYTFATFAKARWLGRSVLDVYHSEFGSYPKSYYESAILQGRILLSDQKVDLSCKIKGGDVLTHTVHRHEPAVAVSSQDGVHVIQETPDLVVVNKPGTLPVHPCGGYHINSLSSILEPRFGKLYNINRLDRLTSGLVLLAKSSSVAQQLGKCLMKRESCQKIYLARVKGKFPLKCSLEVNALGEQRLPCRDGEWIREDGNHMLTGNSSARQSEKPLLKTMEEMRKSNALGAWITDIVGNVRGTTSLHQFFESQNSIDLWLEELKRSNENETTLPSDASPKLQWFHVACPTRVSKPKSGICEAGSFEDLESSVYEKTVKPSQTAFSVVDYDEETDSTVVLCRPMTGRTHQIRLHLQFLGHPIANDPNYGGELWYGDKEGRHAFETARSQLDAMNEANHTAVEQLTCKHADENKTAVATSVIKEAAPVTSTDTPATEEELSALAHLQRIDNEPLQEFIRRTCVWCARSRGEGNGNARTTLEFLCRSRGIWLHALAYHMIDEKGERMDYQTEPPAWAESTASIPDTS
jgi:23S rRNA-/tRNA-specific pseudouridylate synthase